MKDLTKGEVIGLIVSLAKKIAGQQATGIQNISWDGTTNSLVFTMSDGSQISTEITLDASDISYSNTTSGLTATNIQDAIDEINAVISNDGYVTLDTEQTITGLKNFQSSGTNTNIINVIGSQGESVGNTIFSIQEDSQGTPIIKGASNREIMYLVPYDLGHSTVISSNGLRPYSNNTLSFGNSSYKWNYIYGNTLSDGTNSIAIGDIANKNQVPQLEYTEFSQPTDQPNTDEWTNLNENSNMQIAFRNTSGDIVSQVKIDGDSVSLFNANNETYIDLTSEGIGLETLGSAVLNGSPILTQSSGDSRYTTSNDIYLATGNSIILICNGTIESNEVIFTVENDADYDAELLTNGREFEVDLNLAIVGDVPLDTPMYIQFKGYKTPIYNILVNNTTATIRDMLQLSKYSNETGYRWITKMRYILVNEPQAIRAFGIISTVTQQDIIRVTNEDMVDYLANGGLPQGQVVLCDAIESGSSNGYLLGHYYKFNIVYGETNVYSWTDITPTGYYVTLDTEQTIDSSKTFKAKVGSPAQDAIIIDCETGTGSVPSLLEFQYNGTQAADFSFAGSTLQFSSTNPFDLMRRSTPICSLGANSLNAGGNNIYITPIDLGSSTRMWQDLYLSRNLTDGTNTISISTIIERLLPNTTAIINGNSDTATISTSGNYVYLGDVTTLNITATDAVTVTIMGTIGTLNLPSTTNTVLIHSTGYSGTFTDRPTALMDGSIIGRYHIGIIDLA